MRRAYDTKLYIAETPQANAASVCRERMRARNETLHGRNKREFLPSFTSHLPQLFHPVVRLLLPSSHRAPQCARILRRHL